MTLVVRRLVAVTLTAAAYCWLVLPAPDGGAGLATVAATLGLGLGEWHRARPPAVYDWAARGDL
ncbi:MAG: hypothetical protein M3Y91_06685 [Actinomycetota bacterium]|nr:hypothetical protein [Actinomycetota bacterium]